MTIKSTQITVTTTATQLSPSPTDQTPGSSVAVSNPTGGATVYLGGADVTTGNGWPLAAGTSVSMDLAGSKFFTGAAPTTVDEILYGVVASGTAPVNVLATVLSPDVMLPPPSYIQTGLVSGKSYLLSEDTVLDNDAQPDVTYPVGSTLTFTPSVTRLAFTTEHATYYLTTMTGVISATGDLLTPGGGPLYLPANVGQTENDQKWYWQVQPAIGGVYQDAFAMNVVAGVTNYLTDWQPIPAASAASVVSRGLSVVGASADASGNLVFTMSDGSTLPGISMPGGVGGSGTAAVGSATTVTQGVLRLAGDLGGTATTPTVPGLAGKANVSDIGNTSTNFVAIMQAAMT